MGWADGLLSDGLLTIFVPCAIFVGLLQTNFRAMCDFRRIASEAPTF